MIWSTNLRFNLNKSPYREAYALLKNMDRKTHKSINKVVANAVTEYFKRLERLETDPYFETREREETFVNRIVEAVRISVEKAMPTFMAAYISSKLSEISFTEKSASKSGSSDTAESEIDFDFVGN